MQFSTPQDITLEDITYEWLESCKDERQLKRAVQLIEEDGNYYVDLRNAIERKIDELNPLSKQQKEKAAEMRTQEQKKEVEELNTWQKELQASSQAAKDAKQAEDPITRKRRAENEKNKGNEAMNSGDYKDAVQFYTKAIGIDSKNSIFFSNRAMAYLKLKDFRKAAEDASTAAGLDPKNSKAYYRRSLANEGLGNLYSSACDLVHVLKMEESATIRAKYDEIKAKLSETEQKNLTFFESALLQPTKNKPATPTPAPVQVQAQAPGFVKIKIEEEEDDSPLEESDIDNLRQLRRIEEEKQQATDQIRSGDFHGAIVKLQDLKTRVEALRHTDDSEFLRYSIMNNISHCYRQSEMNNEAIQAAYEVVNGLWRKYETGRATEREVDILLKALLRRGLSYEAVEKPDSAYRDFSKALIVSPDYPLAVTHRNKVSVKVPSDVKNEFEQFRRQFFDKRAESLKAKVGEADSQNDGKKDDQKKPFEPESLNESMPPSVGSLGEFSGQNGQEAWYQRIKNDSSLRPPSLAGPLSPIMTSQTLTQDNHVFPQQNNGLESVSEKASNNTQKEQASATVSSDKQHANPPATQTEPKAQTTKIDVNLTTAQRDQIMKLKQQGNDHFEKKQFALAINAYSSALSMFGESLDKLSFHDVGDEKLFTDVSLNLSYSHTLLGEFGKGIEAAQKVINYHPENAKAKYRLVINAEGLLDHLLVDGKIKDKIFPEVQRLAEMINLFLPVLIRSDPKSEKLKKLHEKMEKLRSQIDDKLKSDKAKTDALSSTKQSPSQPPLVQKQQNPQNSSAKQTEEQPKNVELEKKVSDALKTKIERQTSLITEKAIENILKSDVLPSTSSQFETEINSIKGNADHVVEYLSKLPKGLVKNLYSKKQLEFKYFEIILTSLREALLNADGESKLDIAAHFLAEFADTYNAKLVLKMCLKKEKAALQLIVSKAKVQFESLREKLCWLENAII